MCCFEQTRIGGCRIRHYLTGEKHIKTVGLGGNFRQGAREIVNVDHELTYFLSPAVSRSEFPY